jgi:hypothetical protein
MTTAWILQSSSLITGKLHICPSDSNKIQQLLDLVGKSWKNDLLSTKLQRTPIVVRLF